ncbi:MULTISPECIES: glycoside hydrolase family protein [unclassified Burkholderia]|uniref:glycoside hydrolase family protein n=1 Tax=unclassified Burkholderia TaxID=2613784 RepID=UPI001E51AFCF|nr:MULTISPECIES: glycoside hydrolase family protein [unclassified Burkholderia]UEP28331.1 glycoside hydrolase family protein [Burkholderia sp. B21-007]UEP41787.1 glycoside hydrolase family protein [Burkholderia sp. B21-005]
MANESMRLSETGWAELRRRESAVMAYYNDQANNCTYGVGTLAHTGPCTPEELRRPVTTTQVNAQLAARVRRAEAAVRRHVSTRQLTQVQFDELVSYTYNAGNTGALAALRSANQSDDAGVVSHMSQLVWIHPRDENGRRLAPVRSNGLVDRRRLEAAPFQPQQRAQ